MATAVARLVILSISPGEDNPMIPRRDGRRSRRGTAAVEMVLLSPVLAFMAVVTVDFGRAYFATATIANCARNGAFYASDTLYSATSPYATVQQAALADASNLTPAPTVTSATGNDSMGNPYVSVTVTYQFATVIDYPGVSLSTNISRTVQMRVAAALPN